MIGLAGYLAASVRARSSGVRACRSVRTRCSGEAGPDGRSSRARRADTTSAAGPLTWRAATGARPDGAPVPSAPASESAAAAPLPATRPAGESVGAPLERAAAPHLDHQIRPEHRHPAPQVARLTELGRVVVALLGWKRDRRCRRRIRRRARLAIAAFRQDTGHRRHLPAAAIAEGGAIGDAGRQQVEHGACAVVRPVEPGHQHDPALVGDRREGRFEGDDRAARRRSGRWPRRHSARAPP